MGVHIAAGDNNFCVAPEMSDPDELLALGRKEELFKEHAEPVIRSIVRAKIVRGGNGRFQREDAEDICQTIHVQLLDRLKEMGSGGVRNFIGYVKTTAR